ncbi:MAG: hypothetical protein ABI333_23380 [bacterium]
MAERYTSALPLIALLAVCVPGCRDKKPAGKKPRSAQRSAPSTARQLPPLAAWLRQIPSSASWALATPDLDRLSAKLAAAWPLLRRHPGIGPLLRQLRLSVENRWGDWPLTRGIWKRLKIVSERGALVYQRKGAVVLVFQTTDLPALMQGITRAVQRKGARHIAPVSKTVASGVTLWRLDNTWTCGTRDDLALCADVAPEKWSAAAGQPKTSLWDAALASAPLKYFDGDVGLYLSKDTGTGAAVQKAVAWLSGWNTNGFWGSLTFAKRTSLQGLALRPRAVRIPTPKDPSPTASVGLAAAHTDDLVLRLILPPDLLLGHLGRLIPQLRPALTALQVKTGAGSLAADVLNGELLLLSSQTGLTLILGIRGQSRARRGIKRLDLLLGPQIIRWQKTIRELGGGWNLAHSREGLGDVQTQRLTIQTPAGPGGPLPLLRDGQLTVHWGITKHHLVIATDAHLFRRAVARVDLSDAGFLKELPSAAARAFSGRSLLALMLTPDDPLTALPDRYRAVYQRQLALLQTDTRRWVDLARTLSDLTSRMALTVEDLPVGLGCRLVISLVSMPGPHLRIPPRYLEALEMKYGGNRNGHLQLLRALARRHPASPVSIKAERQLAARNSVHNSGVPGLIASVLIPWLQKRGLAAAHAEAHTALARLGEALRRQAQAARTLPPTQRRRWHRSLRSTHLTPMRSCCTAGRRCRSTAADWKHPTWRRLGFSMAGSHHYRFQLIVQPGSLRTRLVLRALGDLDCDGRAGILERVGTVEEATGALTLGAVTQLRPER